MTLHNIAQLARQIGISPGDIIYEADGIGSFVLHCDCGAQYDDRRSWQDHRDLCSSFAKDAEISGSEEDFERLFEVFDFDPEE
jgi:hypothetical protein